MAIQSKISPESLVLNVAYRVNASSSVISHCLSKSGHFTLSVWVKATHFPNY